MISYILLRLRPGSCHDVCRPSCPLRHVPAAPSSGLYFAPPFLSSTFRLLHIRCPLSLYYVITSLAAIMKMLELYYYIDSPPLPLSPLVQPPLS
jgi:hypothetical protein